MPVQRDQDQRREQPRRVQPVAGLDDARGEPRRLAGRAGDELGHHRADQRQAAGDLQPAEEIGHRGRQSQMAQLLPARRAVELEQVEQVVVDAIQPERRVGQDREEGDDPGAEQQLAVWLST